MSCEDGACRVDTRLSFALCGINGCAGRALIDRETLLAGRPDQIVRILEEDANAKGIILGPFDRNRLTEDVLQAQTAVRAGRR